MDVTFILSAVIFTLLAIVVATSLLNGSSTSTDFVNARSYFGGLSQNGHVPDKKKKKKQEKQEDDWSDISGSSHDHWDVVKSVLSDEAQPHVHSGGLASSRSSLSVPGPGSRHMSLEVDSSSEASWGPGPGPGPGLGPGPGPGPRSFIGLSGSELLKCAFCSPQTEGATESPASTDAVDSNDSNSLKYVPGKARSHHLEMMMSRDELEEEQRVQREQLAAIFQLLKDNQETFGEVSEGDMEEQLRLYSI